MKLTSALNALSTATFVILNWLAQTFAVLMLLLIFTTHGPVAQDLWDAMLIVAALTLFLPFGKHFIKWMTVLTFTLLYSTAITIVVLAVKDWT